MHDESIKFIDIYQSVRWRVVQSFLHLEPSLQTIIHSPCFVETTFCQDGGPHTLNQSPSKSTHTDPAYQAWAAPPQSPLPHILIKIIANSATTSIPLPAASILSHPSPSAGSSPSVRYGPVIRTASVALPKFGSVRFRPPFVRTWTWTLYKISEPEPNPNCAFGSGSNLLNLVIF